MECIMTGKQAFNFEKSLAELNQLVDKMEQGNLPLEDSLKHFEDGIKLIRGCQKALSDAEQKVQILTAKNGGEALEDFSNDD
jgi:exodeoxyribonuclease VII small subunit